jgi:hypothetical protein
VFGRPDWTTVLLSGVTKGPMPIEPAFIEKLLLALRDGRISGTPQPAHAPPPQADVWRPHE